MTAQIDETPSSNSQPNTSEEIVSQETGAEKTGTETTTPQGSQEADANDPFAHLRQLQKARESVMARVLKWQRNGLEVELEGGTKAFMPNNMIDRDPNRNIANYFGKTIPVKITGIKATPKRDAAEITVSHRAVLDDESRTAGKEKIQTLNIGDTIDAKIKTFNKDGVVVDLGPGIEAFIRTRDLSWEQHEHPYQVVKRGDTVQAKIINLDRGRRRVQLGVRQLTPDPFIEQFAKYEKDQVIKGKATRINDFGAELELEPGITAFLPISEIAWSRIATVSDVVKEGDEVEVKILSVDPKVRKISVSRKQLIENPLRKIENTFRVGTDHNGTIKEVNRGGVVVDLEHSAEGFVPRRELSHDRIERLEDVFKIGKPLEGLRVIEYDRRSGRVTLSLIAAEKEAQRNTLRNYRPTSRAASFTLGDLDSLKAKLEALERGGQ